ncbi:MAG: PQQ-dependent dehydrogenase, methanol/ethanol family [Pseudomonadales bacterium]
MMIPLPLRVGLRAFAPCALALSALALNALAPSATVQASDAARIANADAEPAQWLSHGRSYSEQRFSPLADINRETVSRLGLTWLHATAEHRGMEATPIVADGVMYVSTAWSRVVALDAVSGRQLWRYDPKVPGAKARDACCDVVNRGVALWGDRVYVGALDGRLIALDADTGAEVWSVQTTDPAKPYTITGAPRVVRGKVIIGNGGAEFGVRGYFSAYDAVTGELVWRFYTVPASADGPVEHEELRLAQRTWSPDSLWETGLGGTVWDSFAYDPELNLLYAGVGNSSQYNRAQRSPGGGDNLFLASILAVNPDSGRLVWHYQTTPGESWDYTATQNMILADIDVLGQRRKVIMQAPKNGFFYVLDRKTGELLSARNYVPVNWASHVDLETGRPVETGKGDWSREQKMVMPSVFGGHNWHPMAYSPATGLVYIPTLHGVYPFTPDPEFRYDPATVNTGEDYPALAASAPAVSPPFCSPTRLTAWDPSRQELAWQVKFDRGISAGVLTTAGGLVFQGTTDGALVAYDDRSGAELWRARTGVGIMAPPISYAVDGVQYVAVVAGLGGALGGHSDRLDNVNTGHVFAFRLDGEAAPPDIPVRPATVQVPGDALDPAAIERGSRLYAVHCLRCHGVNAQSSGLYPDLRHSAAGIHGIWNEIVLDGVLAGNGMASFADVLNGDDVRDIHSFVIDQAVRSTSWTRRALQSAAELVCIPAEWLAD